ncbi:MAG: DUF3341 domain-containing protein [Acidobacteriota bacterium]
MSGGEDRHFAAEGRRAVWGILGEYESAEKLLAACRAVREAGHTRWDAHTPYPVHGLSEAMGVEGSPVARIALAMGLAGAAGGMGLQWWVSAVGAPLLVSGKPFFSWPAFVPIMFETAILLGAAGAFFGFLGAARLPRHHHELFDSRRFERSTDDRFFISIESEDPLFDPRRSEALLRSLGAVHVELIGGAP